MAELIIGGEIASASEFGDNRVSIRWQLVHGGGWRVVRGDAEGQTHTDIPDHFEDAYFNHPLDVHLATECIQGWPKLLLQVWHHDEYGRQEIAGYTRVQIPSGTGYRRIIAGCWRPKGSWREEIMQSFVGGGMQLADLKILEDDQEREKLATISTGSIVLNLNLTTKEFDRFGILS